MASTIKDIAKETGLGLATISSYLNGGNVREKNRVLIENAIKKLNFEVNEVARGLKTNKTNTVGIVLPSLNNLFCSSIVTEVSSILRNRGYAAIVCDCNRDYKEEKAAVEFLFRKRVDAIINMPLCPDGSHLEAFLKAKKPVVLFDREIRDIKCDTVIVGNREAAAGSVDRLISSGHKRIGIITGPENVYTANERLAGCIQAIEAAGLKTDEKLIVRADYATISDGVRAFKELLLNNPDMTAVFASNYEATVGTVIAANEQKISIPEDMSVIGYDSKEFALACRPQLTIIEQPVAEIAANVADIMIYRLNEDPGSRAVSRTLKLSTNMLEGHSIRDLNS